MIAQLYKRLIEPRSNTNDDRRRELILNIILSGITCLSLVSTFASIIHAQDDNTYYIKADVIIDQLVFLLIISSLWFASRKGHSRLSAYILLGFGLLGATQLLLAWSFDLTILELLLALLIVVAGVILTARMALILTICLSMYVFVISVLQINNLLHPDISWQKNKLEFGGSVAYTAILLVIGLVSWLANREIDRSLNRARLSEAALELERDQLEVKVAERTRQLEQVQLERVMELQRLADFGRVSAGLLHDVADPLTVASLNLQALSSDSQSGLVTRAQQSLEYIERFLISARMQLKSQGHSSNFLVIDEIKRVMSILKHRTNQAGVKIKISGSTKLRLFGDPVKLNQIMANLIINAVEAYEGINTKNKIIDIKLDKFANGIRIICIDYGRGLSPTQIQQIFEPFYSTKAEGQSNMGIGLATTKRLIENDFGGKISVKSSKSQGTRFIVHLINSTENE